MAAGFEELRRCHANPAECLRGTRDCQGIDWPIKAELRASRTHMAEREEKAAETVGSDESATGAGAIETRSVKLQR